jgi:hypothetical protein
MEVPFFHCTYKQMSFYVSAIVLVYFRSMYVLFPLVKITLLFFVRYSFVQKTEYRPFLRLFSVQ